MILGKSGKINQIKMPDIEMCMNEECPLKKKCYRYTAIPTAYVQSYSMYKPDEEGECPVYWDNEKYDKNYEER